MLQTTLIRSLSYSHLARWSSRQIYSKAPAIYAPERLILFNTGPYFQIRNRNVSTCQSRHSSLAPSKPPNRPSFRENIYTLPNFLTVSRILACPVLGWSILDNNFHLATYILVYAGLTDLVDGYLARRFKWESVLGTILDPAADKLLMTTLTVTLTMQELLPLPLAVVILGRDLSLSLSALYIRYATLPQPKTLSRYWDFSLPSAEVRPTMISKVNTALQLGLMGATTINPLLPIDLNLTLQGLQWVVATTTVWSGFSYIFSRDAVRIVSDQRKPRTP